MVSLINLSLFFFFFSPIFLDGASVDWPGWCFDDDDFLDYLSPDGVYKEDEGLLQTITQTLTLQDSQRTSERRKGEVSHV